VTLSDVSIRRPVFTTMMSLCLMVLGALGLSRLGTDLFPDVSFPFVMVTTVYRGAGPAEVEQQVVKPIEDAVAGISGVENIQSFSRESVGLVFVQFRLSMSLDRAVQEVRDKVSGIQQVLPRDADLPRVTRIDFGAAPVITYAVSGDLPSSALKQLIKDKLEPPLAQFEGVAQVRVVGGDAREVKVDLHLDKAKSAGIAPGQVVERLAMENMDVPAGRLDLGPRELNVRSLGQFKSVEEIRKLPVQRNQAGSQVRLEEIATISDGSADKRTIARLNGSESLVLEIIKQPGSNTVEVARAVKELMAKQGPALGNGFKASVLIDQSVDVQENAHEVWVALIFGGLMAVVIILIFLLDLRGTLISSLALPTSVVGTFFVMYVLGYTLNQMTLLALSLAIGLLIDDAVVVREAITHRLEKGEHPRSAAANGTRDVYLAVLATTLSLVAVFVPVAFMPGLVGQFFKQFGLTISAAVLLSLFVSFTLDPMLSARFSKARKHDHDGTRNENAVARVLRQGFEAMERGYARMLAWTLAHKWATGLLTVLSIAASLYAARGLGNDFMTPMDRSQIIVELTLPEDASIAESTARAVEAEQLLRTFPDVVGIYTLVGAGPDGLNGKPNKARMRVLLKARKERSLSLAGVKDAFRVRLGEALPATQVALIDPPDIEGVGDFFPVMVYVMGPDLETLTREAERIGQVLRDIPGTRDIRVVSNPPRPEVSIAVDRARAQDSGISAAGLGMQLRLALNGQVAGKLREGMEETDIVVRLAESDRGTPEALRQMEIFTPTGLRAVQDVASVEMKDGPSVIEHFNRQRRVTVIASIDDRTASLGVVAPRLKQALQEAPPPPGYGVFYDGQMKMLDEQNSAFAWVFILALVFMYMVLASQFESFKHPFTILMSVPLALIGALLGLVVTGFSLTLGAMIGVILLMGLVTKNAILLVDQALQNLRAGDSLDLALVRAGPRRLRPILMTSVAMAIGMVPTAVGRGQGFEFRAPMAISVIGGVITSTFLTLFVVPLVFAVFEKLTPPSLRIRKSEDGPGEQPRSGTSHEEAA